jgi:hypothetical protein
MRGVMTPADLRRLLSPIHARILALAEQGLDHDQLAAKLEMDRAAVAPVLQVAAAKLAALETLNLSAVEQDGEVTGELRFTDPSGEVMVSVECADTDTDGAMIRGGTVTESTDDEISGLLALFIKEGDPDKVAVWLDGGENPHARTS